MKWLFEEDMLNVVFSLWVFDECLLWLFVCGEDSGAVKLMLLGD